jgi:hypothetical protein
MDDPPQPDRPIRFGPTPSANRGRFKQRAAIPRDAMPKHPREPLQIAPLTLRAREPGELQSLAIDIPAREPIKR